MDINVEDVMCFLNPMNKNKHTTMKKSFDLEAKLNM